MIKLSYGGYSANSVSALSTDVLIESHVVRVPVGAHAVFQPGIEAGIGVVEPDRTPNEAGYSDHARAAPGLFQRFSESRYRYRLRDWDILT